MKRIITISREYGAGGGTIGEAVADRLGMEYLDKAIILKTAGEAQVNVESVFKMDEMVPIHLPPPPVQLPHHHVGPRDS